MKAAIYYGPMDVRIEDVAIPQITDEDVLIRTRVSLTCGTDVKTYKRGHPSFKQGDFFGHEVAGDIIQVGKNVHFFKEGMRVVTHNTAPCGTCFYCKRGRPDGLCENKVRIIGGHSEYVLVPGRIVKQNMYVIPDDIPYKAAALLEPLACAIYGVSSTPTQMGDVVAVIGAGPLGLMISALLKIKGCMVIQCDYSQPRLEIAKKMQVDIVVDLNDVEDQVQAIKKYAYDGRGADAVIDATGVPEVWEKEVLMVHPAGFVNFFGGCKPGSKVTIDTGKLHYDGITVFGVYHTTPKHVEMAYKLICNKQIRWDLLITRELPFSSLFEALELHATQTGVKNAILYQ